MSNDLIERLRARIIVDGCEMPGNDVLHREAADALEAMQKENEWLKAENFKFCERACNAENELSDKNKRIKDLRNVIANHKDRLTVAAIDLELRMHIKERVNPKPIYYGWDLASSALDPDTDEA